MQQAGLTHAIVADSRPRALAALVRSFRDMDLAEDLFQEACLRAASRWPRDGVPRDPLAWLIMVARNVGLDRIRKERRLAPDNAEEVLDGQVLARDHETDAIEQMERAEYRDDVLRLMFMCCHPELNAPDQLALALKVVVGFSVGEIARAFLVSTDTMQRRLSRAKQRAASVATNLSTPSMAERSERLEAVQKMIYLLFNEGYSAGGGDEQIRHTLCDEAIRLARLLLELFPAQAELMGLLALCLLQSSRHRARIDKEGHLVSLEDQDRSLWDRAAIAEGRLLVEKALRKGQPGPLQVQAAIAAVHCTALQVEDTDWAQIERLYGVLEVLAPGPVVRLNRAVAGARLHGPRSALAMVDALEGDLRHYRPFHSVRAAFLEESGDFPAAIGALEAALDCEKTRLEEVYLRGKIATLQKNLQVLSGSAGLERP